MKLTKDETEFIKSQDVARVATVSKDGVPHSVPICPVWSGGKVYFASEGSAKKVTNMKANPHVAIVFDVYSNAWKKLRGVLLHCRGSVVDKAEFKKIRRMLYAKYPQYEAESPIDAADAVIVALAPDKKFSWGFK